MARIPADLEWHPIETAPRDGEFFYVRGNAPWVLLADGTPELEGYFEEGVLVVIDRGPTEFPDDGIRSITAKEWAKQ